MKLFSGAFSLSSSPDRLISIASASIFDIFLFGLKTLLPQSSYHFAIHKSIAVLIICFVFWLVSLHLEKDYVAHESQLLPPDADVIRPERLNIQSYVHAGTVNTF